MPKHKRPQRQTALVIVEGATEQAFCRYLKSLLSRGRNLHILIENAHGGSPDKIIEFARRRATQARHDRVCILLDSDRAITDSGMAKVRRMRAELVLPAPCIEGLFLELMGCRVPSTSERCKAAFHESGLDEDDKVQSTEYGSLFPSDRFAALRANPIFDRLYRWFANE